MQISYAVKLIGFEGRKFNDKLPLYSFIIMSCEVGVVVAIFFNRFLISHGVSFAHLEDAMRIQIIINLALLYLCYQLKSTNGFKDWLGTKFRRLELWYVLKTYYKYILLRTSLISYSVLLIIVLTRVPNTLHLFWGMSISEVNYFVFCITLMGFLGSFFVMYIKNFISPLEIIFWLYSLSLIENTWYLCTSNLFVGKYNHLWLYSIGFFYGAFLRTTPMVVYNFQDFDKRTQLLGRLISYLLAYGIVGSIALFILDFSYYFFRDIKLPTMLYVLMFVASIGIFGLFRYSKYSK